MINIESLKETLPTFNQVKDNGPYLVFHTEQSIQLAIAEQLQESSKQLKRIADHMDSEYYRKINEQNSEAPND